MIFRLCQRDGLSLSAVSDASGIPYSTVRSYAGHNGDTAEMPVSALCKLVGVLPDKLLSLLLPDGRVIVSVPDGVDHDELADAFTGFLHEKNAAHHPASEAGRDIGPTERAKLDAIVVQLPIRGVVR